MILTVTHKCKCNLFIHKEIKFHINIFSIKVNKKHGLTDERCMEEILKSDINLLINSKDAGSNDFEQHKRLKIKVNKNFLIRSP